MADGMDSTNAMTADGATHSSTNPVAELTPTQEPSSGIGEAYTRGIVVPGYLTMAAHCWDLSMV